MSKRFGKLRIDNSNFIHYEVAVVDRGASSFVFGSMVAGDTLLKNVIKAIKKKANCYIENKCHCTIAGEYDVQKEKQPNSDFSHMVLRKEDIVERNDETGEEFYTFYNIYKTEEEFKSMLFDKLYNNTSVPILEQWMDFLRDNFSTSGSLSNLRVFSDDSECGIKANKVVTSKSNLLSLIQNGLRAGLISIDNATEKSEVMGEINGLDMYLNMFGDLLAEKIQKAFIPKFDPHGDSYTEYVDNYDDSCHYGGIEIYEAQKAVIQAAVNNLDKNKTTFVIGEMGVGKTLLGAGMAYAHYRKKAGSSNIIMCPGHLVYKWQREVEKLIPNAKGYVVENISELKALEDKIKNKNKREHMYIILSKENAKFSYETRPAAVWSLRNKCFVCPECGQPLYKEVWIGKGRDRTKIKEDLTERDFAKEFAYNKICPNKVRKLNKEENTWEEVPCNAKLWTPLNRFEKNPAWLKLGKEGWIMRRHMMSLHDDLFARRKDLNKKEQEFLARLMDKVQELEETGKVKSSTNGVRKYSIAKYVRERLKGHIDYFIGDELHEYKGDSLQGQAMGDLAMAANKVIGLTGTLLNGYADGLFYILYRTMPEVMKEEGFDYSDEGLFQRAYGVVKRTSEHKKGRNGVRGDKIKSGSEKRLPGVSPLVFTKFLLENAVFVSIADMAEGLPAYEEIPIPVDMDDELRASYESLEKDMRTVCSYQGEGGMKAMGSLLQVLSTYPDMPYDQLPILHPDTAEVLCTPPDLTKGLRNKEEALVNLVKEKKANGEKVLVYYEWTNKTDVSEKLLKALRDEDIKAVDLTSKVKAKEREEWVEKQLKENDIDVLMCNPNLVKTGLDLLEFTSIVFYQMGYNIFTMRQASRRSWRLSQTRDIKVYFMYYKNTIQEQAISLMASKLQASMALEGKFSEEGLRAMADNEDLLSQIASSVVEGIQHTVDAEVFTGKRENNSNNSVIMSDKQDRERKPLSELLIYELVRRQLSYLAKDNTSVKKTKETNTHKAIKELFSGKLNIGNMFRAYA